MIVILTGAGISQESGIATFRDAGGLWENVSVEDVATPRAFARDPDKVLEFYNERRRQLFRPDLAPNAAHKALARLEKEGSEKVLLVTQNVDNLHERAGSDYLLHMHGELLKVRCTDCGSILQWEKDLTRKDVCPICMQVGTMRPHIVWFEETPLHMEQIERALSSCRLFVSIGTSGNVYPAAGFAAQARSHGAELLEINLEPSQGAQVFHQGRYGRAGTEVPAWVEEVLSGQK